MSAQPSTDVAEQVKLAAEAFIYGYPLVCNMHEIVRFPSGPNLVSPEAVPYNTRQGIQLAAHTADRQLPTDHAHVPAQRAHSERYVSAAGH